MQIILFFIALIGIFSFADITSAHSTGSGYVAIPEAVRAFYSKEVLFQAQPMCRFLQFAKVKKDLQAIKGKSISFTKYGNLGGGGELEETDILTPESLTTADITIAVKEQANMVTVTELLIRTSMLDVIGDASKLLGNNLATVLDKQFRDVALSTTNIVFGGGKKGTSEMDDTTVFNSKTIKDAVELLAMNNAPKFEGEYYVCIANPKQLRQLRDDSNWINANTYMGRRNLYIGEVGMYEGVVFVETTNMPHLNNAAVIKKYGGTFTPESACEAVVFGENAYAWAVALDVELRDDGVKEMGRKRSLGWYGIWGMGLIEEKNVVKIITSATA